MRCLIWLKGTNNTFLYLQCFSCWFHYRNFILYYLIHHAKLTIGTVFGHDVVKKFMRLFDLLIILKTTRSYYLNTFDYSSMISFAIIWVTVDMIWDLTTLQVYYMHFSSNHLHHSNYICIEVSNLFEEQIKNLKVK